MISATISDIVQPSNYHILVVDDEPIVREFCIRLLRMKEYKVSAAENGRVALSMLEKQQYDLVLTDLQMPEMGGLDLLREIRAHYTDIDVVIFTASATVETARAALTLGAFDYLTKPVSVDDLDRTVQRALKWRLAQREKQHLSEIITLYQISQTFTSTLDTTVSARKIVEVLQRYFSPTTLSISMYDPEEGHLELLACEGEQIPFSEGQVITLHETANGHDMIGAHMNLICMQAEPEDDTHYCTLLLRTNDRPVGVLHISRTPDQPAIDGHERRMLMICASQIAASFDNSRLYRQQQEQYLQTIQAFAALIDARDAYTHGHSEQVMRYAVRLGELINLNAERLKHIRYGALIHDIGKICVRDNVLLKPGRLTDEEFAHIQRHPSLGADILRHIRALRHVIPLIEFHHERLDGSGYPVGLKEDEISQDVRILAISDAFDAMTSSRAYRSAMTREQAFAELRRGSGTLWDADLIDAFIQMIENEGDSLQVSRTTQQAIDLSLYQLPMVTVPNNT